MKTTLLILLVGLVAGANARHYINAESLLEALKRYLGPEELERREVRGIPVEGKVSGLDLLAEKRDTELCANCVAVPLTKAKEVADSCTGGTTEIAPVFEKPAGADCTCLKEYVCCPNPCPAVDSKQKVCDQLAGCKVLDDFSGYYRFAEISDCCGCERRHIAKCPKPKTVACTSCETHVPQHHLNDLGCWEEGCVVTPEPVWPPANCDAKCQKEIKVPATCGFQKPACEGVPVDNCHPAEPNANVCRDTPTKVMQSVYTVGTGSETCSECYKWSHPLIPTVHRPMTCDTNCQTKVTSEDECGNKEDTCSTNEPHDPCHPVEPAADKCKEPWKKTDRDAFNFDGSAKSCSQCFEWKAGLKALVTVPKECDDKCFSTMREDDGCGGWTESCEAKTCERKECRPAQPAQNACHEPPEQNTNTGDYCTNGDGCYECWDWKAPTLSPCPTQLPTCHRYNAGLPDTCFEMITIKGECCDSKDCAKKEEQCVQKFASSDVDAACPEGSVILVGTSTCGTTRDLCYPCIKQELVNCDEACNDVQEVTNVFGCKEDRCVKKACPTLVVPQNCAGTLGVSTNPCGCSIITCEGIICSEERGIDYPGNDIRSFSAANLKACKDACRAQAGCKGYAISTPQGSNPVTCWLKNKMENRYATQWRINGYCSEPLKSSCTVENGIDYPGNDMKNFMTGDLKQCQDACRVQPGCKGYALSTVKESNGHRCWLKNKMENKVSSGQRINGFCS